MHIETVINSFRFSSISVVVDYSINCLKICKLNHIKTCNYNIIIDQRFRSHVDPLIEKSYKTRIYGLIQTQN